MSLADEGQRTYVRRVLQAREYQPIPGDLIHGGAPTDLQNVCARQALEYKEQQLQR